MSPLGRLGLSGAECCEQPCSITDAWTGAEPLSDNWESASGTWTKNTGTGKVSTSNTGALLIHKTPITYSTPTINGGVTYAAFGDKTRVIFGYKDANNYHCAERIYVSSTVATMRIVEVLAGVATELNSATGFNTGNPKGYGVCVHPNGFVNCSAPEAWLYANVNLAGSRWGIGTGDTISGSTPFGSVGSGNTNVVGCGTCPTCSSCIDSIMPRDIQVTISGVANGTCSACASGLNGTFILKQYGHCLWRYLFPPTTPCSVAGLFLQVTDSFAILGAGNDPGGGIITFTKFSLGGPIDCTAINWTIAANGGSTACVRTSASATVLAL